MNKKHQNLVKYIFLMTCFSILLNCNKQKEDKEEP